MTDIFGKDNFNDLLVSSPFSDTINGKSGFDIVDYKFATSGIYARLATPTLVNGEIVFFNPGFAHEVDGTQKDILYNMEGIWGSDAKDTLFGDNHDNNLAGRLGDDTLRGFGGKDLLNGGDQDDILDGGFGDDTLVGGEGNDTLTGGTGADRFTFNSFTESVDTITDFTVADDMIQIKASSFGGGLVPGTISVDQFHLGSAAADSSDRFIYSRTGELFFDADGSGSTFGQVKIATLTDAPLITAANIVAF